VREQLQHTLGDAYRVERELTPGGMSRLFLATERSLDRQVVIKLLPPEYASEVSAARFQREITVTAHLQHPHILPILSAGSKDGLLYYVMPYVAGESLRQRLEREGRLPVATAVIILREVADALARAHKAGIIHRDIKPENILLQDDHAVLADFGVARALYQATGSDRLTETGTGLGTPGYMAPEQLAGERHIDARADVYALGVVGYEMLTGAPPFAGPKSRAPAAAHLLSPPKPVSQVRTEVPAAVSNAITRALETEPDERFASAADFRDALSTAAGAHPSKTPLRSRWAAAAVLGVVLIAASVLLWQTMRGSRSASSPPLRIAVLPFDNLGASADDYFADGMTEELTSRLAKMSGLAVIARTSAIHYKKTSEAVPQIGHELGADYLIEGTVRWENQPGVSGRVRITPQLVRARDGTHVWADEYDKVYGTEIFKMQSDIAERVANALSVTLLAGERRAVRAVPTTNLQAYDYYLRGQAYSARDLGQDWDAERLALQSYEHAVMLDSTFALAHGWAAATNWTMYTGGYDLSLPTGMTPGERLELAGQAAKRALALDPGLPNARVILAYYLAAAGDTARYLDELARVVRGDPNDVEAVAARGHALIELGSSSCLGGARQPDNRRSDCGLWTEGLQNLERAVALDPRNAHRLVAVMFERALHGDDSAAQAYVDRAIAVSPGSPTPYAYKAWLNLLWGRRELARTAMREGVREVGEAKLLFSIAQNSAMIRIFRILDDEYGPAVEHLGWDTFGADSADYYLAKALVYRKDEGMRSAYWDSVALWSRPRMRPGKESNPAYHVLWATGLVESGRRDVGIKEINRLLGDQRYKWDAAARELAAEACVVAALNDCAIQQIRLALLEPDAQFVMNSNLLKIEGIWDPLRGRTDFKKLLEEK
jgi:serine/threonine-protein kinase